MHEYNLLEENINDFMNRLIIWYCRNGENCFVYFSLECLLYWLMAKDICLRGFLGKCFHVYRVLQSVNTCAFLFSFFLFNSFCVLCCTYVPHHEFKNHLNTGNACWSVLILDLQYCCKLWHMSFSTVNRCSCAVRMRQFVLLPCT